jgi:hypothetical protein
MRVFITVLVLIFSLQSWAKADDISDFEIEGMSVGDSLLNYMSEKEIQRNTLAYFDDVREYYVIGYNKNLSTYERLEIYLKTNDKSYKVYGITGGLFPENLNKCLNEQKKISQEIESSIETLKFSTGTQEHPLYKNSIEHYSYVSFSNNDFINIKCMHYDKKDKKKYRVIDSLQVMFQTKEITKWVDGGYK